MGGYLSVKIDYMKILNGSELVGYIKERQAKQVRALRQSWRVFPKLVIISTNDNPVNEVYLKLKKQYGEDILIDVEICKTTTLDVKNNINDFNKDPDIHGIIVQLPISDVSMTDEVINMINPEKDVDGLAQNSLFTPATAMAIDWLLTGYNIDLNYKKIAIVGEGRLVGVPLAKLWRNNGFDIETYNDKTTDLKNKLLKADVIVSAAGVPGLIKSDMTPSHAVIVDAGTASENGEIVGDVDDDLRNRDDLTITPKKGGVGPLTVAALFDNVITSARKVADKKGQQDI